MKYDDVGATKPLFYQENKKNEWMVDDVKWMEVLFFREKRKEKRVA